jgi:HEAT repeat protein
MFTRLTLIAATLTLLCAPAARAASPVERTESLVALLKSDAPLFEKARACQQLGEIGTPDAVSVLAGLLADPKLSAYARSGLEGIPDPSATAALRTAAREIKGPPLAGIVNSLGVLRDPQAVEILGRLAADPGSGVVGEALLALGNISSPASIRLLEESLPGGPESSRPQAAAACLLAADRQRTDGNLTRAVALYDLVRKANVPTSVRVGATRGAILARKADRVSFLIEQLKSGELAIRNAALLTIREIPDDALATALNAEVLRATPELQGELLLALADCHNTESITVVQTLADSPKPEIRKTALTVLGRLGPSASPALLAALRKDRPAEERSILLAGLRGLESSTVSDLLLKELIAPSTPRMRIDLIQLLDSREVSKAIPELLKHASGADKDVSVAALSALSSLAGPNELPALLALAKTCSDEGVKEASENALAGICSRAGEAAAEAVFSELKQATKPSERNTWIRVLAGVGYAPALPLIETAASDPDPAVAGNALAQLGHWPNPAPMETLLKAVDSGASPAVRKQALVSVIDLAATALDENQAHPGTVVSWLGLITPLAQSMEDKRRILGLLGRLTTAESFRLLVPYLDDPALRTEAAAGIVQIAPALAKGEEAGALRAALEKIVREVANEDLRNRAAQAAKAIPASTSPR